MSFVLDKNGEYLPVFGETSGGGGSYVAGGTVYTIEADGTGDFDTIENALSSLSGKFSGGTVTIKFGEGSFDVSNISVDCSLYNFGALIIAGSGVDKTTLNNNTQSGNGFEVINNGTVALLQNFKLKKPANTIQSTGCGIRFMSNIGQANNLIIEGCGQGIAATQNVFLDLTGGNITINYANQGIKANVGGFAVPGNGTFVFNNVTTAWVVEMNGKIVGNNPSATYTSVTNKVSQAVGTINSTGQITGIAT